MDKQNDWKVIDSGRKVNGKTENMFGKQSNENKFQETNLFELLEFEDEPESPEEKTKMSFGNMMKIKSEVKQSQKTKRNKHKFGEFECGTCMPNNPTRYCKERAQGPKKKISEFPPEMVDDDDDDEEWKVYKRAQVPRFSRTYVEGRPKEINVVGVSGEKKKRKGKVTVDSGAEASVWPASSVAWDNVFETEDSRKGIGFVAANGTRMENYGGTRVKFEKDGKTKMMNFQVTDCKKPLASVAKIIERGNRVVFDEEESYILNKLTGEKIKLERERGTFVMVVEFEVDEAEESNSCFRRHA